MGFIIFCFLILTVYVRNSKNVELNELPEEKLLDAVCRSFRKGNVACVTDTCEWNKIDDSFQLTDVTEILQILGVLRGGLFGANTVVTCYRYNTKLKPTQNEAASDSLSLLCKENIVVHVGWESTDDFAYFLEVISQDDKIFTNVTSCNSYTLEDLEENTLYHVGLWAVSYFKKQILHSQTLNIKTSSKSSIPSPVTEIFLQNLTLKQNSYEAVIGWSPNEDVSCEYALVWLKEESIYEAKVNVISGLLQTILPDLNFGANYTVEIVARNDGPQFESAKKSFSFSTPTCLETFHSLDKCHPEKPRNLEINEVVSGSSEEILVYDINLSWAKPELQPSYYIACFINLDLGQHNKTKEYLNVSGSQTETVFEKMKPGVVYHISLTACSLAGCSERAVEERHLTEINTVNFFSYQPWRMLALIVVPLVAGLIATIIINYYRAKQKRREERERYFTGLDEEKLPESIETLEIDLIKKDISDQWELDTNKLYFQSVIGEGAFGIVRRAYLQMKNNSKIQVAVKMLKESPSADEVRQFTQEINIMKSVRQHPYIVSLIGCITEGRPEGPLLVVEYCSRGDLQTYLRNAWDKFTNMQLELFNADENNKDKNYFANKTYDFHNVNIEDEFIIQPKHLLSIARQVALGMEHLAKTRVVHRDLAARNVLVCENHTIKVSDFGLSRDVYRDDVYCKSSGGKLPVRWMAVESLTHQRYTTRSDVWSFGILLWEIVTLGATPYVGLPSSDLLEFLKSGNRLARPSNCSDELYAIMQNCWKASPRNRPTFTELCKSLEDLLENVSQYLQLENINQSLHHNATKHSRLDQSFTSNDGVGYVKPVNTFK